MPGRYGSYGRRGRAPSIEALRSRADEAYNSVSAVSTPFFATKYSFFRMFQDLQDFQNSEPLESQKVYKVSSKFSEISNLDVFRKKNRKTKYQKTNPKVPTRMTACARGCRNTSASLLPPMIRIWKSAFGRFLACRSFTASGANTASNACRVTSKRSLRRSSGILGRGNRETIYGDVHDINICRCLWIIEISWLRL